MSKRKLPPSPEIRRHHPTSPTPLPKPTSSSSSSLMSARHRSSALSNSSPLLSIPTDDSKRPPFWSQEGMVPFVDWITTPANHAALLNHRRSSTSSSSGETMSQALERLRAYVKEKTGVKWLQSQIRSKLQYARKKYDMARKLGESRTSLRDTDTAKLRRRMLDLCPYYEKFNAVYGGPPLPPATAPVHSSAIYSSSSSSSAAAAAKVPYQFSTYSQLNGVGYTSPHESRHPRTSTLVRNPSPSPMDHDGNSEGYEREEEEEEEEVEDEAIDNYHQEYESPLVGSDARDEEEEVRDQSPEEEAAREPSEATYEMVSQQDIMSDHGHGSDYGAAPELDSYRERSVALRTADKGKGPSKRHRTQWGGRYSHHDQDDRDTFMDEFKTVDSTAAAGRIVWIEQDKERMRQLIRKEKMLEERESSWALRMLQQQEQHQAMLQKREEEAELRLKRRFEELEEERQQVRAMQQELAAREKEFYKERESWLAGYAVVKADAAKATALYHAQN
ncbi:hypothetical protein BGZ68_000953 [Mortierella alpina]|nr:hypothetical protein BGZ68_000953 [Mortierella alpina]